MAGTWQPRGRGARRGRARWGRLGYPRRALRLHAAAVAIRDHHDGRVPSSEAALLALPGVGSYTAAAVAAFAFGARTTVVDTNVRRVFARAVSALEPPRPLPDPRRADLAAGLVPSDPAVASSWPSP